MTTYNEVVEKIIDKLGFNTYRGYYQMFGMTPTKLQLSVLKDLLTDGAIEDHPTHRWPDYRLTPHPLRKVTYAQYKQMQDPVDYEWHERVVNGNEPDDGLTQDGDGIEDYDYDYDEYPIFTIPEWNWSWGEAVDNG